MCRMEDFDCTLALEYGARGQPWAAIVSRTGPAGMLVLRFQAMEFD